jgi:hypothetical protein
VRVIIFILIFTTPCYADYLVYHLGVVDLASSNNRYVVYQNVGLNGAATTDYFAAPNISGIEHGDLILVEIVERFNSQCGDTDFINKCKQELKSKIVMVLQKNYKAQRIK